jgi:hypothetical protein
MNPHIFTDDNFALSLVTDWPGWSARHQDTREANTSSNERPLPGSRNMDPTALVIAQYWSGCSVELYRTYSTRNKGGGGFSLGTTQFPKAPPRNESSQRRRRREDSAVLTENSREKSCCSVKEPQWRINNEGSRTLKKRILGRERLWETKSKNRNCTKQ